MGAGAADRRQGRAGRRGDGVLERVAASGRSAATQRSYAMDLLRWLRFAWAVEVAWDRTTRVEARDFCRWLALRDKPVRAAGADRRQRGVPNAMTGKPSPGGKYATTTLAHSETVLRAFYDFHRDAGTGPMVNPFPLSRDRRGGRANAHHNPMEPFGNERVGLYRPRVAQRVPRCIPDELFNRVFCELGFVMEEGLDDLSRTPLGVVRSDLVLASREDDGRNSPDDLAGATVATHLPALTRNWFASRSVDANVVPMGGALEGVCAAGLAEAVVDLRETGTSLARNRLRVLAEIAQCQAEFVTAVAELEDMQLRLSAALQARRHRYLMLHLPPEQLDALQRLFHGLAAPTVLLLAGRTDLVAVHLVVDHPRLFQRLGDLRALGATGIVAVQPNALLP